MESPVTTKKSNITRYILICLVVGIVVGFTLNKTYVAEENRALDSIEISINDLKAKVASTTDTTIIQKLEAEKSVSAKTQ